MRIPTITGIIERRILANYRIDPTIMAAALPEPFRPQLVNGYAIGGICLIRLKNIRPKLLPLPWSISSENAAHRIAVEWDVDGSTHTGVYIPRRDTDSRLNSLAGGRIFPGEHHHAIFDVTEKDDTYAVSMRSDDDSAHVKVVGSIAPELPANSVFDSVAAASQFFEAGKLGYSVTKTAGTYDGLELACENWHVDALDVQDITSSYLANESVFPKGSTTFDCALLMRDIHHEWHGKPHLCCG